MRTQRIRPTHVDVRLLIEVADSSLVQDLEEKAKLYAERDEPEYWGIDIHSKQVRVHPTPRDGYYQSIQPFDKASFISPLCQPSAILSLAELFDFDA